MKQAVLNQDEVLGKLRQERILFIHEDIYESVSKSICSQLLYLDKEGTADITIQINSHGGDLFAMNAICDTMQYVRADIRTICMGAAFSGGSSILMAGEPGKRYCTPNSWMMLHQISTGQRYKKVANILKYFSIYLSVSSNQTAREMDKYFEFISEHTRQPVSRLKEDLTTDLWLSPEEAVGYGVIDKLIPTITPKAILK